MNIYQEELVSFSIDSFNAKKIKNMFYKDIINDIEKKQTTILYSRKKIANRNLRIKN